MRHAVDADLASGFAVEEFTVDLERTGLDRGELDPADPGPGWSPVMTARSAMAAIRQRRPCRTDTTSNNPSSGRPEWPARPIRPYLAIRSTFAKIRLSYDSRRRRPARPVRMICTGVSSVNVRSTDPSSAIVPLRSRWSPTAIKGVKPNPM